MVTPKRKIYAIQTNHYKLQPNFIMLNELGASQLKAFYTFFRIELGLLCYEST